MGLDTTHDCWHGAYSRFDRFRQALCSVAWGLDLRSFDGFSGGTQPTHTFAPMKADDDALVYLLDHSDCDGEIRVEHLLPLAARLEELAPRLKYVEDFQQRCLQFAAGCRAAAARGEAVEFH